MPAVITNTAPISCLVGVSKRAMNRANMTLTGEKAYKAIDMVHVGSGFPQSPMGPLIDTPGAVCMWIC